ncbi:MAG: type I DNA topoisomerase [Bacteroidales bacterium]
MQKNLVIVESPAKAKTIEKFLGQDFKVMSSYGHIRDLKKKDFSIDIANGFQPIYEVPADKKKLVEELKKQAQDSEIVWLASDEDREGEAIAWHLYEVLGLNPDNTKRIVFHEITKSAILNAIEHPRDIDLNLVNAQQARRILDRIVGFELSPVLWRKVKPALSAGRVQSVAVRLIVEREREIQAFTPEASYRVIAIFKVPNQQGDFVELKAELNKRFKTKEEADSFLEACRNTDFAIEDIQTRPTRKSPAAPFTTSTLQQEAARKLGYSVSQTMMIAQKLYENGHITYMRTDSVNLSDLAVNTSKEEIISTMGEKYWKYRQFHTKAKGAQEAHEAIRPTYMSNQQVGGTAQEKRLYELIWKRTIASQMADAELEKTTATIGIASASEKFVAVGEVLKFDGFLRVYLESTDDEPEAQEDGLLPPMAVGEVLDMKNITATERFTQRPPRYSEASLVRKLEELGIGRPSTYAPTISTVQQREYVEKGDKEGVERTFTVLTLADGKIKEQQKTETTGADKAKLFPTNIGIVVNDYLTENFPNIMNYSFTANVEKEFDGIAEGDLDWVNALTKFYGPFHTTVEESLAAKQERKVGERLLGTDPKTGRPVSVKIGRFGPMVQLGANDEEEKPQFATLMKGISMEDMTLEQALKHFELPRTLGEYEGETLTVAVGRFGPYVKFGKMFVSLPKGANPMETTLDEAIVLIEAKKKQEAEKFIKTFDEEPELEVLNGRFGPYIAYKGSNYKIPKGTDPKELTLEQCKEIIENQPAKKTAGKKTSAKKTAEEKEPAEKPKKATAKKPAAKKAATAKKATATKKATAKKATT